MEKMVIRGGPPLRGSVEVGGAKNAVLPALAACLLSPCAHRLRRVPRVRDVATLKKIMSLWGVSFQEEQDALVVDTTHVTGYEAPYDLVKTMRASILLLGPLLSRQGRARISLPGGCAIGARPVNLHLHALTAMGVEMRLEQGYIHARASRLRGAEIFFDHPTVTGTENVLMAASRARGETIIRNAAKEPEIQDLADMLRGMGARIEGDGTDTVHVQGVEALGPAEHCVIPDRIEAGTLMIAGAMTRGEIQVLGPRLEHLVALVEKLEAAGAEVEPTQAGVRVKGPERPRSVDITTMPFPGFPTDLQAQFMALMCISEGSCAIRETVFENRFIHVSELQRMGADIEVSGNQALVRGREKLLAAPVMATDLRASASLVLAGLVAEGGVTEVHRIYHLDRGYEQLEAKLRKLGASVWRQKA